MTIRVLMKGEKKAEILIYSDIGDSWWGDGVTAKDVATELKALKDVDTVDVRINSYGGDVFDGLAIYRQLVDYKATIITHVDGIAASAASVIAMAGSQIHVSETSFIMIHDAWTFAMGNADDLRGVAERVDATSQELAKLYSVRSGKKTETEMRDYMRAETWFNADDAIDAGLATDIVQNQRVAARAVPGFVDYVRNCADIPGDKRPFRNLPAAAAKVDAAPPATVATPLLDGAKARIAAMASRLAESKVKRASGRG